MTVEWMEHLKRCLHIEAINPSNHQTIRIMIPVVSELIIIKGGPNYLSLSLSWKGMPHPHKHPAWYNHIRIDWIAPSAVQAPFVLRRVSFGCCPHTRTPTHAHTHTLSFSHTQMCTHTHSLSHTHTYTLCISLSLS